MQEFHGAKVKIAKAKNKNTKAVISLKDTCRKFLNEYSTKYCSLEASLGELSCAVYHAFATQAIENTKSSLMQAFLRKFLLSKKAPSSTTKEVVISPDVEIEKEDEEDNDTEREVEEKPKVPAKRGRKKKSDEKKIETKIEEVERTQARSIKRKAEEQQFDHFFIN